MFDAKRVAEILSELYSDQYGYPVKVTSEKKEKGKNITGGKNENI